MLTHINYQSPPAARPSSEFRDWVIILSTSATLVTLSVAIGTAAYFFLAAVTR